MTVAMRTWEWRVKPAETARFVDFSKKAKSWFEANGASVRLWQKNVAGPESGTWLFACEFPSVEKYGAAMDKALTDATFAADAAAFTASGAAENVGNTLVIEVPL